MAIIHSSEDLYYVSVQFDDSKTTVTESKQFLFVEMDNVGKPWGDDVHGKLFGEKFEPSLATIKQLLIDMENGLTEIGSTFYTMSVDVENTEDQATS